MINFYRWTGSKRAFSQTHTPIHAPDRPCLQQNQPFLDLGKLSGLVVPLFPSLCSHSGDWYYLWTLFSLLRNWILLIDDYPNSNFPELDYKVSKLVGEVLNDLTTNLRPVSMNSDHFDHLTPRVTPNRQRVKWSKPEITQNGS